MASCFGCNIVCFIACLCVCAREFVDNCVHGCRGNGVIYSVAQLLVQLS